VISDRWYRDRISLTEKTSLIVTLDVPGPRVTGLPSGAPTNLYRQRSIVELVNRQSAAVAGIGQGIE
jgi:hypothetical protein